MIRKSIILITLLLTCSLATNAQTIESLNEEIAKAEQEIALNEKLLNQIKADQTGNEKQLKLIRSRISSRQKIVRSLNSQINMLDKGIKNKEQNIVELNKRLAMLKNEYGNMIYESYKNYKLNNSLLFLFASKDFNDITRRLDYMRRYNNMRKDKAVEIDSLKIQLGEEVNDLTKQINKLDNTKESRNKELSTLEKDRTQYSEKSKELQQQQSKVSKTLEQKRLQKQQAERQLQRIIAEEARKARAQSGDYSEEEQRAYIELSGRFDQNKGKLPMPVTGVIIDHFGVHQHPTQKNLTVNNKGINIAAERGGSVFSVFDGVVSRVVFISGLNNCVMIRHGEYFTVYSNLTNVNVKTGDVVSLNQKIGSLSNSNDNEDNTLHFELWRGTTNLDPEPWLD
ncbi:MAG: peptidoglycan DD-metalloendopeptidase family protein [Tidjanibacter sp.]|nr:peptidoglycan DD-metalloendopeptidase family protein [Tidjanibacter sp.]MBR6830650.1 peptidoglycan DD-metalloendopeptidase family protein [Tidjanibacter sp.]